MRQRKPREDIGPTPETAAKLIPDQIDLWHREEYIGQREVDAADELEDMWYALGRGLFSGFDGNGGGSGLRGVEALSVTESWKWSNWFRPWNDKVGRAAAPVYRVVFANEVVGSIERGIVIEGLKVFASLMERRPLSWREVEKLCLTA